MIGRIGVLVGGHGTSNEKFFQCKQLPQLKKQFSSKANCYIMGKRYILRIARAPSRNPGKTALIFFSSFFNFCSDDLTVAPMHLILRPHRLTT